MWKHRLAGVSLQAVRRKPPGVSLQAVRRKPPGASLQAVRRKPPGVSLQAVRRKPPGVSLQAVRRKPPGVWLTRLNCISWSIDLAPGSHRAACAAPLLLGCTHQRKRFFPSLVYSTCAVDYATTLKTGGIPKGLPLNQSSKSPP